MSPLRQGVFFLWSGASTCSTYLKFCTLHFSPSLICALFERCASPSVSVWVSTVCNTSPSCVWICLIPDSWSIDSWTLTLTKSTLDFDTERCILLWVSVLVFRTTDVCFWGEFYLEYLAVVWILLEDLLELDDERREDDAGVKLILLVHLKTQNEKLNEKCETIK